MLSEFFPATVDLNQKRRPNAHSQILKYNIPVASEMEDINFKVVNNFLLTNRKNTKDSMNMLVSKMYVALQ